MKTILITSQKGGAGKTTIARSLAVAADAAGQRVVMIDLDPQKSLREWWEAREAATPAMLDSDPSPAQLGPYLKSLAADFDLVVIDTPPRAEEWLTKAMGLADLTVIPVRASPDDLRAVKLTLQAAKSASAPFVFVLSQTGRDRFVAEALEGLAAHGRVCPTRMVDRVAHREASGVGQSAGEGSDPKARLDIEGLWAYIEGVLENG
jgi:chromosome partitioning protein